MTPTLSHYLAFAAGSIITWILFGIYHVNAIRKLAEESRKIVIDRTEKAWSAGYYACDVKNRKAADRANKMLS